MSGKNRIKSGAVKKTCRNDHTRKANNESYKGNILVEEKQSEQEQSAQNQPYNVVISNVSPVRVVNDHLTENQYEDEMENKYICHMTNEAPIKSLMDRLNQQGQKLNKIILIESDKVSKEKIMYKDEVGEHEKTHVNYLKSQLNEYAKSFSYSLKYAEVKIKNEPSEQEVFQTVSSIYEKLSQYIKTEVQQKNASGLNIYIESNGGVRYVLTMLLSLTQTLERCYENVHIVEISSMVFGENQTSVKIKNTKAVYDSSQITGIIDEFISYGRCSSLQRYIDAHIKGLDETKVNDIQDVLHALIKMAEDIQLCRTSMMLDDFYKDGGMINKIETFVNKYQEHENMMIFVYLFKLFRNEFAESRPKDATANNHKENIIYLPNMIKWCLDKSFTLQALTLCSEKTAEYLFAAGLIKLPEGNECLLENNNNKNYEKHYYFLSNLKRSLYDKILPAKINAVLRKMKDTSDQNNTFFQDADWDDMFIMVENDQLGAATCSEDMKDCSKEVWAIVKELIQGKHPTDTGITFNNNYLDSMFNDSIFGKKALGVSVATKSDEKCIKNILNGQNLTQTISFGDSLKLIIPKLVEIGLQRKWDDALKDANTRFNKIVDAIFPESEAVFKDSVKKHYNSPENENPQPLQSEKYYILDAIQTGFLKSENPERLQEILYVYSICKEQRNLSSHANVSEENKAVAMNSEQLHRVIERLLGLFTGTIEPVTCKSEN